MNKVRQIVFYKNHFSDFYDLQGIKVRNKIDEVLYLISIIERVPRKFLDHMTGTDGLYEIRIELGEIYLGYFAVLMKED